MLQLCNRSLLHPWLLLQLPHLGGDYGLLFVGLLLQLSFLSGSFGLLFLGLLLQLSLLSGGAGLLSLRLLLIGRLIWSSWGLLLCWCHRGTHRFFSSLHAASDCSPCSNVLHAWSCNEWAHLLCRDLFKLNVVIEWLNKVLADLFHYNGSSTDAASNDDPLHTDGQVEIGTKLAKIASNQIPDRIVIFKFNSIMYVL